ncbi:MAG: hypothetical protein IKD08_00620 [Alphaproteobacteria bacterium]|nr:hypothetical protein [Elusimicrobiaceae bacterium]MBR7158172.1 hypothetical protein [Alphaproteobacteria bacterium]
MMKNRKDNITAILPHYPADKDEAQMPSSTTLFVSLYFIVLVFFIVLSSMTVFAPAKVSAVTSSVKNAFGTEKSQTFSNRFLTMFHNIEPLNENISPEKSSDKLYLSFAPGLLFAKSNQMISPRYRETFSRLYQFLTEAEKNDNFTTEISISYPSPELMNDSISKAAFLAEDFQKHGIKSVSSGVVLGKEYRLFIIISRSPSVKEE